LEFETTMTKLTLMSTFWLLIGAARIFGTPMDPTEQLRVNVKVKTEANEETSCIEEWQPCYPNPGQCCDFYNHRCCQIINATMNEWVCYPAKLLPIDYVTCE